jgi:hypothetical protein
VTLRRPVEVEHLAIPRRQVTYLGSISINRA